MPLMWMIRPGFPSAERRVSMEKLVRQTSAPHGVVNRPGFAGGCLV